ncbi:DUF6541 family protein [Kineococcus rhizosphaerae]|uniref:Uncharacterized protein n=1 Tax=Kineococcus rhizosphaerae TaxID=559628 RepID=A0A2T0R0F7_9ACTN|nr:DUF6541 family protein [Kineococcus rhizosphaerae]PRY12584.1 hypothetical protein CLV37_110144 [Kineococcus rhizosphaerae]
MSVITGGTPAGDVLTLAVAALWVLVPGAAVLLAGGVRRPALLLGAAPATSVGLSTLAATATGLTGTRFSWWTVLVATAVLAGVCALVRGRRTAPFEDGRTPRGPAIAAGALVLAAAATTCELFRRGLGTLATPSQEHDTITHTLVTARILRTGQAAPWKAQALDVVTGDPARYYPNGLHQWAALVAQTRGVDAVSGLNATSVVVLAVVQTLGLLALAATVLPRRWLPAGGVAAVAASLAYQPLQAMHHDSGALPNAAAIAFAPGVIALLLPPAHRPWRGVLAMVPAVALAAAGAVTVHPSAALTVGGGFLGAWVAQSTLSTLFGPVPEAQGVRPTPEGRSRGVRGVLRAGWGWRWIAGLALAGALAGALVGASLLQAASAGGGSSSRFARDIPVEPLTAALHRVLALPMQGGIDPTATHEQWWLAVAVVAGALLAGRKAAAVLVCWAVWSAIAVAYLIGAHGPLVDLVWDSAWNSYYRVVAHGSPWAWLLAGVAVARLAETFARRADAWVAAALGAVLLAGAGTEALPTEVRALRERYAAPAYQRVDTDDRAAARYLAAHVRPGQRVLNSGNDGSTYDYVLEGVPVMATTAVPTTAQPDLRTLTRDLRAMTPEVRALLARYDVAYVVVDADAPGLPLTPADAVFFGVPGYAVPPGLSDLDAVAGLRRVFTSGTVGVWEVLGQGSGA